MPESENRITALFFISISDKKETEGRSGIVRFITLLHKHEVMSTISPTHTSLLNSTKQMAWWLSMYNTACSIAIHKLPFASVRRLVALDCIKEPMEEGEEFTDFRPGVPAQVQQLMGSMTDLCRDAAIANESLRVLFSTSGRSLKPVMYAATKLSPLSDDPKSDVEMEYAGVLTCCDFAEEDSLATVGVAERLEDHIDVDECAFCDVVCSTAGSRAGRSLLAQFLIDLKRCRGANRKLGVVTVAVSKAGRNLFRSFNFSEVKFKGNYVMYASLDDITFDTLTTALRFGNSENYIGVCFRHGLTTTTKDKVYPTGCR